ncbi:hypothetical protein KCMC57_up33050 [Kitasatospora sp. CMC57]|uniref:Uncharacterized protein n=1 Tax=Kitasatospora sp. CMC57 TaxID=3231513 RepID=A0AB33K645_9ACTN
MSDPKIMFTKTAAGKIKKLSKSKRKSVVELLAKELSNLGSGSAIVGERAVSGTNYVVLDIGDDIALVRPMDPAERTKFDVRSASGGYFVADMLPAKKLVY